ncbi:hypothetical protein D9757_009200 [Collybiopsis confluens]|uniref:Enoyl reductase (ER) domain-containing protein n=1 Tax=Collybiopsis confluens TaxID=2823264 RepID=A0A8H5HAJ2_9AGAR|nr:hypothetical protein D9757_009200 [Collybiopsis confluens]
MAPVTNPRIVFKERPQEGLPIAGKHIVLDSSHTIDLENVPLNGGYLTKSLVLSPEPAMRERMRDPSITSYTTTYITGAPIVAFAVVVVVRSEKEEVKVGQYMYGQTPWEAYTVQPYIEGRVKFEPDQWAPGTFDMDSLVLQPVPDPKGAYPLSTYTNILGTPGMTAFVGMEGVLQGKKDETLFVSSGASGVGSLVIQLAKMKGMKVIASAGSDAKVKFMLSLGADNAFNYKKESYGEALKKYGPIHAFWDNVGAEALDAALEFCLPQARFAICGASGTDSIPYDDRYRLKNASQIQKKRLKIQGFVVPDYIPQFAAQFFQEVPALVAQGKLKSKENTVGEKWDDVPQSIADMLKSGHDIVGKPVVTVGSV